MITQTGQSWDDEGQETVPGEIPANGHVQDDGDGRDDDLRPLSANDDRGHNVSELCKLMAEDERERPR